MFEKPIAHVEAFFKGMMFDCHACGQCVLSQTGLICPMSCPKGLRNGPCGGTLDGKCEVYPDKLCVWCRIHGRTSHGSLDVPKLLPSPDARLFNTASYLNFFDGKDQYGRTPLAYLDLGNHRTSRPIQTQSPLEQKLKSGLFVKTCEVRSPRGVNLATLNREVAEVKDHFDAVNATAFLNAKPSLPSMVVAAKIVELGVDPISQATCRDNTKTVFISSLLQNQMNGVHNILCLTGDSYAGVPKVKQVFDMDSALMIYEARHLRETGIVHFTGEKIANAPRPFIGGALNPFTTPANVPIRRLKQKIAAGVDFIQTQLVFDVSRFAAFMATVVAERLNEEVFIIAGVPVVTSAKVLPVLSKIAGVMIPDTLRQRLEQAPDCRVEGIAVAREIVAALNAMPGVAGVHLMLFGPSHGDLPLVLNGLDLQTRKQ